MKRKTAQAPLPSSTTAVKLHDAPTRDIGAAGPDQSISRATGGEEARETKLTRRKMLTILSTAPTAIVAAASIAGEPRSHSNGVSPEVAEAIIAYEAAWQAFEDFCPVLDDLDERYDPSRIEEGAQLDDGEVEARLAMLACPMHSLADFAAKAEAIQRHNGGELGTLDNEFLDALLGSVRG